MTHFEMDFLPVGEKSKSADAIAMRFGDFGGSADKPFVVVVDGGTQESGKDLVAHLTNHYHTNVVDIAVLTHPDSDHASGLKVVLEEMVVGHLLMHKPWEHSSEIVDFIEDERVTTDSLRRRLRKSLADARDLENIANRKGIRIIEPFADVDLHLGPLHVLSPTLALYETLLPQFRNIGESLQASMFKAAFQAVGGAIAEAVGKVFESIGIETLADPADDGTSAENDTSVVLHYKYDDDYQCVLTGDGGVLALACAAARADALGINLQAVNCIQVPHHGSRHNVGPTVLDRIVGPKQSALVQLKNAVVSASRGDDKHPSKKVTNAFCRRGAPVTSTQHAYAYLRFASPGTPNRPGCAPVDHLPLYEEFEED